MLDAKEAISFGGDNTKTLASEIILKLIFTLITKIIMLLLYFIYFLN